MPNPNAAAPSSRLADEEDDAAPPSIKNSRLVDRHYFDSRIVMVTGEINHTMAERVCVNLFALAQAGNDPITMIISSPGGHVESGDMIHDMIKFIKPRVRVLGSGWVASAGALIYIAADKKDRYILPNTRFLLHAPSGGVGGFKEIIALVEGRGAYSKLKYESGVHRVQRVPATEGSGRIHTSAATVAELIDELRAREERYALAFGDLASLRVALDQELAGFDAPLAGVREVAFFPPMTGG